MNVKALPKRAQSTGRLILRGTLLASLLISSSLGISAYAGEPAFFCSFTAIDALRACKNEVKDDFWIAKAICINVSDRRERHTCNLDARSERIDAKALCEEQFHARLEVCDLVGEQRYDPDFSPANFVDPDEIGKGIAANPYLPLIPGAQWTYESEDESNTVTVTNDIKLVEGVKCRVVSDIVTEDGVVREDTDDWFAQDLSGNVWYCGEEAKDFEIFEGDDPMEPELVSIDGSFKHGRDGDKAGILILANPQVGDAHRQEVSLGNAEDVVEVISVTGTESAPAASCSNDCLVTRDFTPLDPGVEENKYYVPGIGLIVEVGLDDGSRNELVEFTIP